MKNSIVLLAVIFLLLQNVGCKKENIERVAQPPRVVESPSSPGPVIIEKLTWIFPWYNAVEIKKFNNMVPEGNMFKVFIQREYNPEWKEVPLAAIDSDSTIKYEYFIETRPDGAGMYNFGSLYIFYYGNDVSDNPSVKIEY